MDWSNGDEVLALLRSAPSPDTTELEAALERGRNQVRSAPPARREELLRRLARRLPRPVLTDEQIAKLRVIVRQVAEKIDTVYDDGWDHWKAMMEFLSASLDSEDPTTVDLARRGLESAGMLEFCLNLDLPDLQLA